MKNVKFSTINLLLVMSLFSVGITSVKAMAVSSYYTENDYEKTSTYASVGNGEEEVIIDKPSIVTPNSSVKADATEGISNNIIGGNNADVTKKTIKNNDKVYNTIIVRTKKQVQQSDQMKPEKIDLKQVNTVDITQPEEKNNGKKGFFRNFLKNLNKKEPDKWYIYTYSGYSLNSSSRSRVNAVYTSNEHIDKSYTTEKSSNSVKGNGYDFMLGSKIYIKNFGKFSLFIGPEFFYSKLNLNTNSSSYTVIQEAQIDPGIGQQIDVNAIISSQKSVKAKDMYGMSFRVGTTYTNMISMYGKISLGGLRYGIDSSINPSIDNIDWHFIDGITDPVSRERIQNEVMSQLKSFSSSKTRNALLCGIGTGIEFNFLNQHLSLRVDYDHYFSSGTFVVGSEFARAKENPNGTVVRGGTKWKFRNNFGLIRLMMGISF